MVFSSIVFIFAFLPVFLAGYYASGWRTGVLLVGSAAFYTWGEGAYVLLLGLLIALNWGMAFLVARSRWWLAALAGADLLVLGFFKYAGFLAASANGVLPGDPVPVVSVALPLGISFFTFQLVSYAFDVARGTVAPERDPVKFAAYILMFPHLIAGPIVRYADIRDELHADRRTVGRVGLGVQYFIVGLCQKVLIANVLAPVADHGFGLAPGALDASAAWASTVAYTLQIYFDFCGYSNMAIGLAFMLGFTYPKNFDYPYASRSITEFWRRWHISLSSWFRDYVYIPLGGNRGGTARTVRNLMIVFLLTGLWHGAAWSFVVWGLYHGAFLMLERFGLGRLLGAAPRLVGHLYAVGVVMGGWVFFRAEDLPRALAHFRAMAGPWTPDLALVRLLNNEVVGAALAGAVLSLPVLPALMERLKAPRAPASHLAPQWDTGAVHVLPVPALLAGLVLSIAYLASSSLNPFLYFRF